MARTTSTAVEKVLGGDYDADNEPDLTPYIETAGAIVTRVAVCAAAKNIPLTVTELELLERWLAAHFYGQSDKPLIEERTEKAMGKYSGETGMGLDSTLYGQTAMRIDPSGCLNALNKRQSVQFAWLGKPPSEQTDYTLRD